MEVKLRATEPEDLDFLYYLENLPDVMRMSWGEAPMSRHIIWQYLQTYTADILRDRQLRLIIEAVEDDPLAVGTIDLSDFDPINSRAMVGIALAPEWRGQKIATCALDLLIHYCTVSLNLHQLFAFVTKDNVPSIRLFTNAGFKSTGCLKSWYKKGSQYSDVLIFQLMLQG